MAWIAVDKNGYEYIYDTRPTRKNRYRTYHVTNNYVLVPNGTSLKLTGKQMTWDDEPVELT